MKRSSGTLRPCPDDSESWDSTNNVFIESDNLEALKLLQKSYHKKVKLIYIDPPYNTGNDIVYKNDFEDSIQNYKNITGQVKDGYELTTNTDSSGRFHSDWLSMMYPRLKLAKGLLTTDGIFAISIDHNELYNTGLMCDEIFGTENRIGVISVVHKPEGRNQAKFFGTSNEFMLFYANNKSECHFNKVVLNSDQSNEFDMLDDKGSYRLKNYIRFRDGKHSLRENKPDFWYPAYVSSDLNTLSTNPFEGSEEVFPVTDNGQERTWKTTRDTMQERIEAGNVVALRGEDGKLSLHEKMREEQVVKTHWLDKRYHAYHYGTKIVDDMLGAKSFDFPKSVELILDVVKLTTSKNDIVLDFFAGSGTTAHAVMKLNSLDGGSRKFILVQLPEKLDTGKKEHAQAYKFCIDNNLSLNLAAITKERMRKSAISVLESIKSSEMKSRIDCGYRVFKLDSSNIKAWDDSVDNIEKSLFDSIENIKEDRTSLDVLFELLIKYGLPLTIPIDKIQIGEKCIYSVGYGALIVCLEDNITASDVEEIGKVKTEISPSTVRVIFKDSSFVDDAAKVNAIQILKQYDIEDVKSI